MVRIVSFSGANLKLIETTNYHEDSRNSLSLYYSPFSPLYSIRFMGYQVEEINRELAERLDELDRNSTMNLLASVEAAFRVDYLQRCYRKKKDPISRIFIDLHKKKGSRISFEDEILQVWKDNTLGSAELISELRGAFNFRHWLAHGRYWTAKLGKKYDYISVYPLALQALSKFPLLGV